jgi:hypothetical protein
MPAVRGAAQLQISVLLKVKSPEKGHAAEPAEVDEAG